MKKVILTTAVLVGSSAAMAAGGSGPDYASLTGSIDMGTTITAVMAVAASMVGIYLAIKGAKIVLRMIKGG